MNMISMGCHWVGGFFHGFGVGWWVAGWLLFVLKGRNAGVRIENKEVNQAECGQGVCKPCPGCHRKSVWFTNTLDEPSVGYRTLIRTNRPKTHI